MLMNSPLHPVIFGKHSGNDQYTKVLLHFDGVSGSTSILDNAKGGAVKTWTATNGAALSTTLKKFGPTSLLCDGVNDYVTTPDHADFNIGANDFTVDYWFNVAGGSGTNRRLFGQTSTANTSVDTSISGGLDTTNVMGMRACSGASGAGPISTTTFTSAGWHHCAFVSTRGILRLFINGIQEGGDVAAVGPVNNVAFNFSVGRRGEVTANPWNGSIDEFRLSVGVARWTTKFIPPQREYA